MLKNLNDYFAPGIPHLIVITALNCAAAFSTSFLLSSFVVLLKMMLSRD